MTMINRQTAMEDLVEVGLADDGVPPSPRPSLRLVCPRDWTGRAVFNSARERVFVCGACQTPNICSGPGGCVRAAVN